MGNGLCVFTQTQEKFKPIKLILTCDILYILKFKANQKVSYKMWWIHVLRYVFICVTYVLD